VLVSQEEVAIDGQGPSHSEGCKAFLSVSFTLVDDDEAEYWVRYWSIRRLVSGSLFARH